MEALIIYGAQQQCDAPIRMHLCTTFHLTKFVGAPEPNSTCKVCKIKIWQNLDGCIRMKY